VDGSSASNMKTLNNDLPSQLEKRKGTLANEHEFVAYINERDGIGKLL
jgi:hypothetical protein